MPARSLFTLALVFALGGCAVVAVTDAAVSVAATVVKVGANVVGGAVDVARAGVRAITPSDDAKR